MWQRLILVNLFALLCILLSSCGEAQFQAKQAQVAAIEQRKREAVAQFQAKQAQLAAIERQNRIAEAQFQAKQAQLAALEQQNQKAEATPIEPAEPAATPTANTGTPIGDHYLDHGDGTVTDTKTGLMWQRCAEGQTWTGDTCSGEPSTITLDTAMPNGQQKSWPNFAAHGDWRVPSKEELLSLVYCSSGKPKTWNDTGNVCDGEFQHPTIDIAAFPNTQNIWYWSATANALDSSYSWIVYFDGGYVSDDLRGSSYAVRLVCGGQ